MKWTFGVFAVIAIVIVLSLVLGGGWKPSSFSRGVCLSENESASYTFEDNARRAASYVTVTVQDDTETVARQFRETILAPTHYHPIELHPCGAYFARSLNYDYASRTTLVGYTAGIWKYDYMGRGEEIVTIGDALDGTKKSIRNFFSSDFRVSPDEKLILLERGYSSDDNYALVVKDIAAGSDVFVLPIADLWRENEHLVGNIMFLDWTREGQYFWFSLFEAAYVNGWVRIDSRDWSYELFEAPEGVLGGYPLNLETGWVPLIPGAFWTGVVEFDEDVKQERAAAGETANLYLYNVFSKERRLVEDTDVPIWRGLNAKWLSDSELEYTIPNGTKKTYRVGE